MSEPFCIIGSKGKFSDNYTRYLPALESLEDIPNEPLPDPWWSRRQWAIVLQLKSQQEGFQKRFYEGLNEMKSTPKGKGKSKY